LGKEEVELYARLVAMKKLMMIMACLTLVYGCASSKDKLNELKMENKNLKNEVALLESNLQENDLKLSGDFTVTVYQVCPDYELGDEQHRLLLVSFFQCSPFLLRVPTSTAKNITEQQAYTFQLKNPIVIENVRNINDLSYEQILSRHSESVIFVGSAKEDEIGLNSNRLEYEQVK